MASLNRQRGLLKINTELQSQGSVDRTGLAGGLATVSAAFGRVGQQVGALADHAAAIEGAETGRRAGLDPEFRPTGAMTIRGEAYDKAGLEVYGARTRIRFAEDMAAAYDQHQNDPQALAAALDAKGQAWIKDALPEIKPELQLEFEKSRFTYMRQAARTQAARIEAEQKAALQDELGEQLKTLSQRAYWLGLDEKADDVLASDVAAISRALNRRGLHGTPLVTPAEAQRITEGLSQEVATARLLGAFERTEGLAAKQAFIDKFREDYGHSTGLAKVYDLQGFQTIERRLEADLARATSQQNSELRILRGAVKDQREMAEKGFAPRPEELAALKSRVAASGDAPLSASLSQAENLLQWQSAARVMSPGVLDQQILAERERLAKEGATPYETERLAVAESLLTNMRTELARDPLGWTDRVGLLDVQPLDLSGPDQAAASIRTRVAQAEQTAAYYGQKVQYLRPDEARALTSLLGEGGATTLGISNALAQAVGPERAPEVFAELGKDAPALAMLGGLIARVGGTQLAQDAAEAIELRRQPEYKPLHVARPTETADAAVTALGEALAFMPQARSAVIDLANAAYERRAGRRGITQFDIDLWSQTLRETLGEREAGGETYGGITSQDFWGGGKIVLPPELRNDSWDEFLAAIRPEDLSATGIDPPTDQKGVAISLNRLRNATFVTAGAGVYAVAFGDPSDPETRWWPDPAQPDGKWRFDATRIIPFVGKRRPDLFFGQAAGGNAPDAPQVP